MTLGCPDFDVQAPGSQPGVGDAYIQCPAWMPYEYDVRADALVFAYLPRATQRSAVFLDPRFLARAEKSPPIRVVEMSEDRISEAAGPLHFIFHTGFCCSTLLTRALDIPGVSMGLKEPVVLAYFGEYWSQSRRTPGAFAALEVALNLLSRPLEPGESQIVKPTNAANHAIPQLLHARPDAKALVLYSSLEAFLRAIARRGMDGRSFARSVFQQFAPVIPLEAGFQTDDWMRHTDLQIAAQAWLMQASFMDSIAKRFGPNRIRVLNSETFLNDKARALAAVGDFFKLPGGQDWDAIANAAVFSEHAKEYGRPFDVEAYRAQQREAEAAHREELQRTMSWARALAGRCNAPLVPEETLFQA